MTTQTTINLRTAPYNELNLNQRAEALVLAYQDGAEAMESDLVAADGHAIGGYEMPSVEGIGQAHYAMIELAWQTDECPESDLDYWRDDAEGDPRLAAFVRGWTERAASLRADAES